eukprot:12611473-Heterocapsa_arctica.AAC.1
MRTGRGDATVLAARALARARTRARTRARERVAARRAPLAMVESGHPGRAGEMVGPRASPI